MSRSFKIEPGRLRVIKDGVSRLDTDWRHMVVLSRVVGTHSEPQRSGSRSPSINNNIDIDSTSNIDTCDPGATHLLGSLVITLGAGSAYDPTIPDGKHYAFMGGTFIYAHMYTWFAGYTIYVDNGVVKLRRRVISTYEAPSSGTTFFNLRAFDIDYNLRAVRFL